MASQKNFSLGQGLGYKKVLLLPTVGGQLEVFFTDLSLWQVNKYFFCRVGPVCKKSFFTDLLLWQVNKYFFVGLGRFIKKFCCY
jgi:hypothetical protein